MLPDVARRQHSIFTLAQALESGFTRPVIRRKLDRGEWIEVEPRAYRVALAGPLEWRARLMALTLASGGVASLWSPRRRGCALVFELLDQRDPEVANARNIWEARVSGMARTARLPRPRSNYLVHVGGRDRFLDLAWPEEKVAAEFDGFVPHSTRRVFDDDRVRQNDLVDDDWLLFRLTKSALEADRTRAFDPIVRALGKRLRNGTLAFSIATNWKRS